MGAWLLLDLVVPDTPIEEENFQSDLISNSLTKLATNFVV